MWGLRKRGSTFDVIETPTTASPPKQNSGNQRKNLQKPSRFTLKNLTFTLGELRFPLGNKLYFWRFLKHFGILTFRFCLIWGFSDSLGRSGGPTRFSRKTVFYILKENAWSFPGSPWRKSYLKQFFVSRDVWGNSCPPNQWVCFY